MCNCKNFCGEILHFLENLQGGTTFSHVSHVTPGSESDSSFPARSRQIRVASLPSLDVTASSLFVVLRTRPPSRRWPSSPASCESAVGLRPLRPWGPANPGLFLVPRLGSRRSWSSALAEVCGTRWKLLWLLPLRSRKPLPGGRYGHAHV